MNRRHHRAAQDRRGETAGKPTVGPQAQGLTDWDTCPAAWGAAGVNVREKGPVDADRLGMCGSPGGTPVTDPAVRPGPRRLRRSPDWRAIPVRRSASGGWPKRERSDSDPVGRKGCNGPIKQQFR
jgi:hypothetical protein